MIVAFDLDTATYVRCAENLAFSIRRWCPDSKICLLTNQLNDNPVFDIIKVVEHIDTDNVLANDWLVFYQSPFRETIKLEADMLVTSPIDHWWTIFRHRDVVISLGCRDWQDRISLSRHYRRIFDVNDLPDVYNAVTYWRLSETAKTFFDLVRDIFMNWQQMRGLLKFSEDMPSTDVVYAMAAKIMGTEKVTLPDSVSYPKIIHMKKHHAQTHGEDWSREMIWESDPLRINTLAQHGLLHYHIKNWVT